MTSLAEVLSANAGLALAIGGFVIGLAFGALVQRTNFCTMGAVSDAMLMGDRRRLYAWGLAIAVAIAGTHAASQTEILALDRAMYLSPALNWVGHIGGGLMFGFGMVLAGGCPSRNLVRAGSGDLRSLIVLMVVGIMGFVTIGGILGPVRVWIEQATQLPLNRIGSPTQGLGDVIASLLRLPRGGVTGMLALGLVAALLAACLTDRRFRTSHANLLSGVGIGLLVVAGWLLTGLAYDEFSARPLPPVSLTFVRPSGDTLDWLQRATGLGLPGFGVATILGAILGAGLTAWASGKFHLRTFADTTDTLHNLGGAALMGIGGAFALGCSVGQGITGVSTLAIGSILTLCAVVAGSVAGIRALERWAD